MTRTITIEHEGKTYKGELGTIKSTTFGYEDHGIVTAYLHVEWPGGGISVGGFSLDTPVKIDGKHVGREGTAYGLDHLVRLMETVGVRTWEKIPGSAVIVLFDAPPNASTWGSTAAGIAGAHSDKVLILKDHVHAWSQKESERL